ncbi:hydantoinase/oxoprolinase family protein [Natronosalvus halobius]|uniref:hydantoinase/oxoprolinase family protein n=1 Tax=Natronosalvus halobius TaxID=2953746 RepID=UPI00209E5582|nr:hydantoinase/oxoprolinase family protein [Natronosalvus halobius]USZ73628.1 hydantoinase/oxoprolinase family protein [Natronosalvus halobius]
MPHVIGVDTGGTFTDTVIVNEAGERVTGKSGTTPADPATGIMNSLSDAARALDSNLETVLEETEVLFHGTTLTTNTVLERTGGDVGLITTKGHRDALHIGRTKSRTTGLSEYEMQHYASQSKPEPIVPKQRIQELDERIDYKGSAVVGLDDEQVREAVRDIVDEVDSLAVNLLWSFENPDHEQRVAEIAAEEAPDLPTYLSHEVTARLGEYERGATTAVNAYTAPILEAYVEDLVDELRDAGLDAPVYIMKSTGGAMPVSDASTEAVATIMSGPTGGVIGSQYVGTEIGTENLICTDVGGTSFDVGLIIDGEIQTRPTTSVHQYTLYQLTVDIDSIGSGGGSIAWIDEGGALRVGPDSAGADPGPACYGQGGTRPTVTDADLLLGYISPDYFLGGRRDLDADAAETAMREHVAEPLDMTVEEAAAGVFEIVNGAMADLLRQMTIERGHDPREFSVLAYGGAGPLHASFYADDLDAESVVIPLGDTASVFSAFGIASSDLNWVEEVSNPSLAPFDPADVTEAFEALESAVRSDFDEQGVDHENVTFSREVDLRYKGQVHQVSVDAPTGGLTETDLDDVLDRWEAKYEGLYGSGSTYADAQVELVNQRVLASAETMDPTLSADDSMSEEPQIGTRDVYWPGPSGFVETDIYDGERIVPDMSIVGPAIVQLPDTTVTIRPHQEATVDDYRNIVITEA